MNCKRGAIRSLKYLLEMLYCNPSTKSKKVSTELFFYKEGPKEIRVKEVLKSVSDTLLERYTPVPKDIFHEALDSGYIRGKCAPGPKECFYLTPQGEIEYLRLKELKDKQKKKRRKTNKEWSKDDPSGCS